jgi:hypothetical protein
MNSYMQVYEFIYTMNSYTYEFKNSYMQVYEFIYTMNSYAYEFMS